VFLLFVFLFVPLRVHRANAAGVNSCCSKSFF
jgi:hypothetical protein